MNEGREMGGENESNVMGGEPLQVVPLERMKDLIDILHKDIPYSLHVEGMVKNIIRWRKNKEIPNDYELYAPYGDVNSGACIGVFDTGHKTSLGFHSPLNKDRALLDALLTTSLINWGTEKRLCFLHAVSEKVMPIMEKIAEKKNLTMRSGPAVRFWMEKERAINLKVECPPGVEIKPLSPNMAAYLDEYGPHGFEGSDEYFRRLLERNFGIGVFIKNVEMPVAWVLLNQFSCMFSLFTLEAHRKKGYAELVCNAMAKRLAEMGVDPNATVLADNQPSKNLFIKMGYLTGDTCYYVVLKSHCESCTIKS